MGWTFSRGRAHLFALVARAGEGLSLSAALTDRSGRTVYDCRTVLVEAGDWTRYEVELVPNAADPDGDLRIFWEGEGAVCLGALSLMPKDHFRGMRRDVVEAMKEIGISVLRWPGGNFAGEYNWMDGLLPVDMRAPLQSYLGLETQLHTMGYDYDEINTDDFVALCREIGAEPFAGYDMPCVDLAVNVDVFPRPNGGAGVNALSWQGGGKVASGLTAAARLGARCAILGAVGSDDYGRFCEKDFQRHGVDTAGLLCREGETTSLSIVISDRETQGRSIVYRHGSARPPDPEELDRTILENCRWFFISHVTGVAMEAVQRARAAGAKILVDADAYSSELMDLLDLIDVFIGSEFCYQVLFHNQSYEENCRTLCEKGPSTVIFTLGPRGCAGFSRDWGGFRLPAYQVPVMDTTGAGDVFHGAYLAGAVRGLGPAECARLATAAACIKCTRMGGRAGVPDWETLQVFMKTGRIDYEEIDRRAAFYEERLQV